MPSFHTAGSCASSPASCFLLPALLPASWSLPRTCSLLLLFFSRLHDSAPSIFLLPSSVQTLCVPYLRTGALVTTIPVFVCSSFRDHSSIPTTTTSCQVDGYKAPIESSRSTRAVWSFRLFELEEHLGSTTSGLPNFGPSLFLEQIPTRFASRVRLPSLWPLPRGPHNVCTYASTPRPDRETRDASETKAPARWRADGAPAPQDRQANSYTPSAVLSYSWGSDALHSASCRHGIQSRHGIWLG